MIPLVSVIVPTYNSRATLTAALASIQRQDCGDFEVWVVGDACTDGSEKVVAALGDARFHWFNRAANSGGSSAPYREGLQRSSGRFAAYLGHDDLWFPWHLSSLLERITADGAALVHGLSAILGPGGYVDIAGPPPGGGSYRGHFVPPSSWLHNRALPDSIGGWLDPELLPRPNDFDLLQRIVASGARITCSPRLSVLKWPSASWKSYAADAPRPQIGVAAELAVDANGLANRILNDYALSHSRHTWRDRVRTARGEWMSAARHASAGARLTVRSVMRQLDGTPRWPFRSLMLARYQRVRRRYRHIRGLEK